MESLVRFLYTITERRQVPVGAETVGWVQETFRFIPLPSLSRPSMWLRRMHASMV